MGTGGVQEAFNAAVIGAAEMLPAQAKGWLLASLLHALENSKANNVNYSPASLGAADDAFVYLNPSVKAKIVFSLLGHTPYGHQRNKQSTKGKERSTILSSKIHLRC